MQIVPTVVIGTDLTREILFKPAGVFAVRRGVLRLCGRTVENLAPAVRST